MDDPFTWLVHLGMDLLYMDGQAVENVSNLPWHRALEEMDFWVYLQNGWI